MASKTLIKQAKVTLQKLSTGKDWKRGMPKLGDNKSKYFKLVEYGCESILG
jgi:hypothetical protein